jgi:protease I
MDQPIVGRRLLIFVGEIYEDLEVWYPKLRMIERYECLCLLAS